MPYDQPDNATRLWRLGVSRWVLPSEFTGSRVAETLCALLGDPKVQTACRRRAEAVHTVDAVAQTCDLIEEIAPDAKRQRPTAGR